ncbi:Uncharacterised protein [Mycobacterium tuberculosis]|nr:Uncharacterised protein [Mycobacterium tuberculosis]
MVVHTSTSKRRSQKSTIICSRRDSLMRPWAVAMRASGTSLPISAATSSMSATRLCTKKTCPSRMISRRIAAVIWLSVRGPTKVSTGWRSSGAVAKVEVSRIPVSDISRVRGIGVALMASTSTLVRICLSFSLCSTPKRCSSSIMTRPRSLNTTLSERMRCVPITTSTAPDAISSVIWRVSFAFWKRESTRIFTGKPEKRSLNVS